MWISKILFESLFIINKENNILHMTNMLFSLLIKDFYNLGLDKE